MKFASILIAFILLGFCSEAQTLSDTSITKYALNKKTVVTNKQGNPYAYGTWSKLIASKSYGLKPVNAESDSTAFILYKYNEPEENKAFGKMPKPEESGCFKNGDKFKFFDLTDINGKPIKVADMAGKIVVINFWFIACPICRYEMPELNRLVDTYKNNKDEGAIELH